jgi:hypothetical protein
MFLLLLVLGQYLLEYVIFLLKLGAVAAAVAVTEVVVVVAKARAAAVVDMWQHR